MCPEDRTQTMAYSEGHIVPRKKKNILKLTTMIADIDKLSAEVGPAQQTEIMESMPSLLSGANITEGLAFLSSSGIQV